MIFPGVYVILLFLQSFVPSIASDSDLASKQKHCTEILDKLKKAKGLRPSEKPYVRVVEELPGGLALAMYETFTESIMIQMDTYDMCMQLLEKDSVNALAFILAHELAHYTHQHNVRQKHIKKHQSKDSINMAMSFMVTENVPSLKQKEQSALVEKIRQINRKYRIINNEAQADLDAGFTCFLAGYDAFPAGAKFLEEAYQVFDIDTSGGNYASLKERKLIVEKASKELDTLVHVFNAGNYAMCAKDYEIALRCYSYVSDRYESHQILNNIGVLKLMMIIKERQPTFALPLSLELDLYKGYEYADLLNGGRDSDGVITMNDGDFGAQFNEYDLFEELKIKIDGVIDVLDKCLQLNERYNMAFLNKSIAHYLLHYYNAKHGNQWTEHGLPYLLESEASVKNAMLHKTTDKFYSDCLVQMGVIFQAKNDTSSALKYFEEARKKNSSNPLIDMNIEILNKKESDVTNFIQGDSARDSSKFCTITERDSSNALTKIFEEIEEWTGVVNLKSKDYNFGDSWIFYYNVKEDEVMYAFREEYVFETQAGVYFSVQRNVVNSSTKCRLKKGDNLKQVLLTYGKPDQFLQTENGSFYLYEIEKLNHGIEKSSEGLIFSIDAESKIVQWIDFYRKFEDDD